MKSEIQGRVTASAVRLRRLTYLDRGALADLHRAVRQLSVPGDVVEAGCALGGSSAVLANALPPGRHLHLYDTFGMIPPPSPADGADVHARYEAIVAGRSTGIRGGTYYGYQGDLRDRVRATVRRYAPHADVTLHQGLYEDTFHPEAPVALAHLDCDWYDSVTVCLTRLWPRLVPGGRVIIDDYDAWSGARSAVDDFIGQVPVRTERWSRLHLVKP